MNTLFCFKTIKKKKKTPTEWEKIFANHVSVKYPEYIKNSHNSIIKRQPNLKIGKRFE
jgi:hypothetical protein